MALSRRQQPSAQRLGQRLVGHNSLLHGLKIFSRSIVLRLARENTRCTTDRYRYAPSHGHCKMASLEQVGRKASDSRRNRANPDRANSPLKSKAKKKLTIWCRSLTVRRINLPLRFSPLRSLEMNTITTNDGLRSSTRTGAKGQPIVFSHGCRCRPMIGTRRCCSSSARASA